MSLKRLDSSLGGIRIGRTRFMTGERIAPVFQVGPFALGRRVTGDLEPGIPVTLERKSSAFENYISGKSLQLESTGELRVLGWSEDPLGETCKILRIISLAEVNHDPKLRHFIHNPERR